uniref:Reverse transcriptase zinc-binding domain-containing protein n=1 Tax=Lactuca sativa TaxID=4236 RepID=A0A9R1WB12_LACSA|nr:hypothetical protein LSAT_V11C300123990 [Lactuca sativa]
MMKVDRSKILRTVPNPTRWNGFVPRKVNILVWRIRLNRLPTKSNLDHRGIDIPSTLCPIYNLEVEQLDHLFTKCKVPAKTWDAIFKWLDIQLISFDCINGLINLIDAIRGSANKRRVIDAVVNTTLWYLWRFRNDIVFEGRKMRNDSIVDSIRQYYFLGLVRNL